MKVFNYQVPYHDYEWRYSLEKSYYVKYYTKSIRSLFFNSYDLRSVTISLPNKEKDCFSDEVRVVSRIYYKINCYGCYSTNGISWYILNTSERVPSYVELNINNRYNYEKDTRFFISEVDLSKYESIDEEFLNSDYYFMTFGYSYADNTGYHYINAVEYLGCKMVFSFASVTYGYFINTNSCSYVSTLTKIRDLL